jgi:hypothetical protein
MACGATSQVCVERGNFGDIFLRWKHLGARNHNMEMRNTNLLTTKGYGGKRRRMHLDWCRTGAHWEAFCMHAALLG